MNELSPEEEAARRQLQDRMAAGEARTVAWGLDGAEWTLGVIARREPCEVRQQVARTVWHDLLVIQGKRLDPASSDADEAQRVRLASLLDLALELAR